MEPFATLALKGPVLLLKTLSNGALSAVDADSTLYFIHPDTFKIIGGCRAAIGQQRPWGNHVDVGLYAQVFAAVIPKTAKAALYAVKKKKVLYRLGRHQGQVESVAIDPKTRYMLTGGEDGKLFAWEIKTGTPAFTLPAHTDHVTAIAFSDDAAYVATGSYDKLIHFMPFEGTKRPRKLYGHRSAVVKLSFIAENRLVSAGKGGEVLVWDLERGKIAKRLEPADDEITALCLCGAKRYLFVGTKAGAVRLYDLQECELLSAHYLQADGAVTSLAYMEEGERLAVGTLKGRVDVYAVMGDETALSALVDARKYAAFYAAAESNVLLRASALYEAVEGIWNETVAGARRLYEAGDVAGAKALLDDFADVARKKPLIRELLHDSEAFALFKEHVDAKRYALAYAAAERYPQFKSTAPYEKMENEWHEALGRARELAGERNGEEEARAVLASYRGISAKTAAIQQLLHEGRYLLFLKDLIAKQEWKKLFALVKQHPFLKESREFFRLVNYADKLFIEASQAYAEGNLTKARQLCEVLENFPDFKADVREMLAEIHKGRKA